ncbi:MAG: hypothetical protein IH596_11295 [Bacteroidales bacterium]|nr:hypothetical protein [Bacteroidales bacterium]
MPRLYIAFAIFTLFSSSSSFSQRPDLIIGAHLNQQMLFDPGLDQHYYTPGIAVDMEVSKNKLAGGISLGMKGADPRNRTENPTQFIKYFVNVDLSFGVFLIKHPAFKWRFNMGASNMFNVNKYRENSAFNIPGYSLLAYPELHFRYKYYIASVYYSLPLVGFDSRGTGIKIGIGF